MCSDDQQGLAQEKGEPISLTKLMVSHDLLRSTVANQIAFDQRDSKSIFNFERAMDRCY